MAQKKQFLIILLIVFLGFLGISMPYLIFPALFLNPEYSILPANWGESSRAIFLGITLAAYPLGQFIGSPILGALSDDYGRKKILSGSLMISAFCNLFTGLSIEWQQLGLLIFSRFIAGLMEGNVSIARAMAADIKAIAKQETFGKINAVSSIAYLIGPLLGGLMTDKNLMESFTAATPFYCICILFIFLSIVSVKLLKNGVIKSSVVIQTIWQRFNLFKRLSVLFSNKKLQFLMIVATFFTLAVDCFYEFGPIYLTIKWSLGPSQLIVYNGVLCLGLAIGNGWLPVFFSSRIAIRTAIICFIGVFAILLMGTAVTNSSLVMMLLFGFSGIAIGLVVTLITVEISDSVADSIQGEVMGIQISLRVLGDALICLFGSALLLISFKFILIFASIMSIAVLMFYSLNKKSRL